MGRPHQWPGARAAVWPLGLARGTAGGTELVAAAEECSEAAPAPRWAEARV